MVSLTEYEWRSTQLEGLKAGWGVLAAALAIGSGVGVQLLRLYENTQEPFLSSV